MSSILLFVCFSLFFNYMCSSVGARCRGRGEGGGGLVSVLWYVEIASVIVIDGTVLFVC